MSGFLPVAVILAPQRGDFALEVPFLSAPGYVPSGTESRDSDTLGTSGHPRIIHGGQKAEQSQELQLDAVQRPRVEDGYTPADTSVHWERTSLGKKDILTVLRHG